MSSRRPSLVSRIAGFIPLRDSSQDRETDKDILLATVPSKDQTTTESSSGERPRSSGSSQTLRETDSQDGRHAGRRRKHGHGRYGMDDEESLETNAISRLYSKVVGYNAIARYMVYIVPVGFVLAIPLIVLIATGQKNKILLGTSTSKEDGRLVVHDGPPLFRLFLWMEITWLSLWIAKIVAFCLPKVFVFLCSIVSLCARKYATIISNLDIPLSLFFWALTSWLTYRSLFLSAAMRDIGWVVTVERILGSLFISSALLLTEKAIVQLISVSNHQRSFATRIEASKREISLLSLLYDFSRTLYPLYTGGFEEEDQVINDSIEMTLRKKAGLEDAEAIPIKIIGDAGRVGTKVASAVGNIAHEITGKKILNPSSAHSMVVGALEKRKTSEALAQRIWMSFVPENKTALFVDDVRDVLGPQYEEEAVDAFEAFDNDGNGDIGLDEMIHKVVEMSIERKAIGEGMKDIGQALGVFDDVLMFVVLLLAAFVFLVFFNSSLVATITGAGTTLLSLSFVFAVTAQEFLGSCIFLFVKHPFDVGDRVEITSTQMVVDKISLLYTVFTRLNTKQVVQIPNIQLNQLWIDNISRSKAMSEIFDLVVSYDTPFDDIELLHAELEKFIRLPENSHDFQPSISISVGDLGSLDKMHLYVEVEHKSNWHSEIVRSTRRSRFMCALIMVLRRIPIRSPGGGYDILGGPENPTYSVSVSDTFASEARQESERKKDAKRMVPARTRDGKKATYDQNPTTPSGIGPGQTVKERQGLSIKIDDCSDSTRRFGDTGFTRAETLRRHNTRGRRKVGEHVEYLSPTTANFRGNAGRSDSIQPDDFDEEAQTGRPPSVHLPKHRGSLSSTGT